MVDDYTLIEPILKTLPDFIMDEQRMHMQELLLKYTGIFSKHEFDLGKANRTPKKIQLKDSSLPPVRQPLRAHPYAYLKKIDDHGDKLLEAGIITPCNSAWASNLLLVPKRGQPGKY